MARLVAAVVSHKYQEEGAGCPISRVLCEKWGLSPPAPERLIFHLGADSSQPRDEESPGPVPPALRKKARRMGHPRLGNAGKNKTAPRAGRPLEIQLVGRA